MTFKYLLSGFFVKLITGFDDVVIHIPIMANITRTRKGRIAFSIGIFTAVTFAIIISFLFASLIKSIPYFKYILSALIFILAITIYFELFVHKTKEKVEKKLNKIKTISTKRIFKLIGIGFITGFVTVIDDSIAYSSLFLGNLSNIPFVIIGIFTATLLELTAIVYFSKKITGFRYKKEITTIGLIILGFLILSGVL